MITAVTGASGYLGGALVRSLLAEGREVRAVDLYRGPTLDGLDVQFVQADILDSGSTNHALHGVDAVYHLAALIAVAGEPNDQVWAVNVDGVANVAQAALRSGVRRMVHCSSVHAYDLETELPEIDEQSPKTTARTRPVYDRSKAAGEEQLRDAINAGLDAVIVNPTGVIGPLDFAPSRMGEVFKAMFTNTLPALVDGAFDWVDLRDVASSILEAERHGETGNNYLLPGHHATVEELANLCASISGVEVTARPLPMWAASMWRPFGALVQRDKKSALTLTRDSLHALKFHPPVVGEKARQTLGHSARPTAESITDIYNWFKGRGDLDS